MLRPARTMRPPARRSRALAAGLAAAATLLISGPAAAAHLDPPSTLTIGGFVPSMALSPDGKTLYAAAYDDDEIAVIDTATGASKGEIEVNGILPGTAIPFPIPGGGSIPVGGLDLGGSPNRLALTPDGTVLFVSQGDESSLGYAVISIDTATRSIITAYAFRDSVNDIQFSSDGHLAYVVTDECDITILVAEPGATDAPYVASYGANCSLTSVVSSHDGLRIFAADDNTNGVLVIDQTTGPPQLITTHSLSSRPNWVSISADNSTLYISHNSGGLDFMDVASGAIESMQINGARAPLTVSADGSVGYLSDNANDSVSVIDLVNRTIVDSISVGDGPRQVLLSPDGATVYALNSGSGTVSVFPAVQVSSGGGTGGASTTGGDTTTPGDDSGLPDWLVALNTPIGYLVIGLALLIIVLLIVVIRVATRRPKRDA
jgi:YVTN family beta-propeller protein